MNRTTDTRKIGLAISIAALAAALVLAAPGTAAKKKGGGAGKNVNITKTVNAPIPDAIPTPAGEITGILNSSIDVGKQFKGLRVRDVNVTVQTLGGPGNEPVSQLQGSLRSPSGQVAILFGNLEGYAGAPGVSIGPLTLDDESRLNLGDEMPVDPTRLYSPWAGSATPTQPLAVMDNGSVRGTWTLTIRDFDSMVTSTLVSWRLNVVAGRPFQTK